MSGVSTGKKFAFSSLTLLLVMLVVEVLFRIVIPERPSFAVYPEAWGHDLVRPHPLRGYTYAPNGIGSVDRGGKTVPLSFNSRGLRGPEFEMGSAAFRILAVGDSFTAGWGLDLDQAWPSQLERELGSFDSFPSIEVINAAVSGYSMSQMRLTAIEYVDDLGIDLVIAGLYPKRHWRTRDPFVVHSGYLVRSSRAPRLISEEMGFFETPFKQEWMRRLDNGLSRFWRVGHYAFRGTTWLRWQIQTWNEAAQIGGLARSGGSAESSADEDVEVELFDFIEEIRLLNDFCEERKIPLVLLFVNEQEEDGTFMPRENAYNAALSKFSDEQGIPYANPLRILETESNGQPIFRLGTDNHWSAPANRIAAHEAAIVVRQILSAFHGQVPAGISEESSHPQVIARSR